MPNDADDDAKLGPVAEWTARNSPYILWAIMAAVPTSIILIWGVEALGALLLILYLVAMIAAAWLWMRRLL